MRKARVSWDATADLDEIWLYIARRDNEEAAERFINSLADKFVLIASFPITLLALTPESAASPDHRDRAAGGAPAATCGADVGDRHRGGRVGGGGP